jgi:pyridoxamine 5'-phosphate oxidase-like protein
MARFYTQLTPELIAFIQSQPVFFTASAARDSRINLSPKGLDTLRVLSPSHVAYLDLTGSGNETAAHANTDGRLTFMFCSFSEKPMILRLYGRGSVATPRKPGWAELIKHFTQLPGQRQIISLHIESLQTSCGFGVPEMALKQVRTNLPDYHAKKGEDSLVDYWGKKNVMSIDGLPTHLLD